MKYNYQELQNVETLEAEEMEAIVGGEGEDVAPEVTDPTTEEPVAPTWKGKEKNANFRKRKRKNKKPNKGALHANANAGLV